MTQTRKFSLWFQQDLAVMNAFHCKQFAIALYGVFNFLQFAKKLATTDHDRYRWMGNSKS